MVIDSDILIDLFRDIEASKKFFLETKDKIWISRVTAMEVTQGVKTKVSGVKAQKQISSLGIELIEVNETVSKIAWDIFYNYFHKTGIGILDSFIAATALYKKTELVTRNVKHFKFIKGLELIVPY